LREGPEVLQHACPYPASGEYHEHYGESLFHCDGQHPSSDDLANVVRDELLHAGVASNDQVVALGKGKMLRKAVSTMLHTLPSCPFPDTDIAKRILHSRKTWQAAYTITVCARHRSAWSALCSNEKADISVADVVRL
jgi:hypothetical protein